MNLPAHILKRCQIHGRPRSVEPDGSPLSRRFVELWNAAGGPPLEREYRFDAVRMYRFDFAHPAARVAVEIEGGVWTRGRHTRPKGFVEDCRKYNLAAAHGWAVIRLPEPLVNSQDIRRIRDLILSRTE